MSLITTALVLGGLGFGAGLIGAIFASARASGSGTIISYVQHFAAGIIIAAAALDLMPAALGTGQRWPVIIGFAVGTVFMVLVREATKAIGGGHGHGHGDGHGDVHHAEHQVQHQVEVQTGINWSLIISLGIVILIDGAIIGIATVGGDGGALLIAIALALELLFVSASVSGSIRAGGSSFATALLSGGGVALMLPIGALIGALLFADVSVAWLAAGLSFGAAALLFTAIEELLLEAHEVKESAGTSLMAGAGFLVFIVLLLSIG